MEEEEDKLDFFVCLSYRENQGCNNANQYIEMIDDRTPRTKCKKFSESAKKSNLSFHARHVLQKKASVLLGSLTL